MLNAAFLKVGVLPHRPEPELGTRARRAATANVVTAVPLAVALVNLLLARAGV